MLFSLFFHPFFCCCFHYVCECGKYEYANIWMAFIRVALIRAIAIEIRIMVFTMVMMFLVRFFSIIFFFNLQTSNSRGKNVLHLWPSLVEFNDHLITNNSKWLRTKRIKTHTRCQYLGQHVKQLDAIRKEVHVYWMSFFLLTIFVPKNNENNNKKWLLIASHSNILEKFVQHFDGNWVKVDHTKKYVPKSKLRVPMIKSV